MDKSRSRQKPLQCDHVPKTPSMTFFPAIFQRLAVILIWHGCQVLEMIDGRSKRKGPRGRGGIEEGGCRVGDRKKKLWALAASCCGSSSSIQVVAWASRKLKVDHFRRRLLIREGGRAAAEDWDDVPRTVQVQVRSRAARQVRYVRAGRDLRTEGEKSFGMSSHFGVRRRVRSAVAVSVSEVFFSSFFPFFFTDFGGGGGLQFPRYRLRFLNALTFQGSLLLVNAR